MTTHASPASAANRLRDIVSITDAYLCQRDDDEFLTELLDRTKKVFRADTAALLLLDEASRYLTAAAAAGLEDEVRQGVRIPVGGGFAGRIAAEQQPKIIDRVDQTTVVNPILIAKGIRAMMGVPVLADGTVIGVLHVGSLTPREFTGDDVGLLRLIADRAATAVVPMRARRDRIAAAELQLNLLPPTFAEVPGAKTAARYIRGSGVAGGGWYDVFTLPGGELGIVVGQVTGAGLRAAVIMGRMRSALRAYAVETPNPGQVLDRLDRMMRHFEPGARAAVLYAVADPAQGRALIASAGHCPPVVAPRGEPTGQAEIAMGPMIGASPHARRPVTTVEAPPGAVLCFFTNRQHPAADMDLKRLQQALASDPPDAISALVSGAMTGSGHGTAGDIALLVFASPTACQPGARTGPAAHRLAVMPIRCPHGHTYTPGSFTVTWEYCPCRPSGEAEPGHHLITCHTCTAEQRPPAVNIPKCRYLDL